MHLDRIPRPSESQMAAVSRGTRKWEQRRREIKAEERCAWLEKRKEKRDEESGTEIRRGRGGRWGQGRGELEVERVGGGEMRVAAGHLCQNN